MLRNIRILILVLSLAIAAGFILFKGIKLGTDFTGGTVLMFKFDRPLSEEEMSKAVTTLEKRVNWTGLLDVSIRPWGNEYVYIRIGDVDPETVNYIKEVILRQGLFEVVVMGDVALTGDQIILRGDYTLVPDHIRGGWRWSVPFILKDVGAKQFFSTLRKYCTVSYCPDTYFFIDRPTGAAIFIDKNLLEREVNEFEVNIEELSLNAGVKIYVDKVPDTNTLIITTPYLRDLVEGNNVRVIPVNEGRSWLWDATGLRSIVGVDPALRADIINGVTNITTLSISGWAPTKEEAQRRIDEIVLILSSGSLPAGLSLVSQQQIPPTYGERSFVVFMGALLAAMIVVAIIISLRYRAPYISIPIIITIISEIILVLGFAAAIEWRLDVPSMVGLIAAVGSGVDDQIIITDELLRKRREEEEEISLISKIKRAFFVVFASASALGAVMIPIWFSGITSLVGFAITTLAGILMGVLITRPAYAEMLKYLLTRREAP